MIFAVGLRGGSNRVDDLISRQVVIDALHTRFRDGFDGDKWWNSTHVLATIEGLPSAQPETEERTAESAQNVLNGELISKKAAIDAVETKIKKWNAVDGEGYHVGLGLRYTDVISTLTELPSAQPERTKGRWIDDTYCDQCGWTNEVESGFIGSVKGFHFCPNCGAEMRSKEDGE